MVADCAVLIVRLKVAEKIEIVWCGVVALVGRTENAVKSVFVVCGIFMMCAICGADVGRVP